MDVGVRMISPKHNLKISVVDLSEGMKEIIKLQNANPIASVALARVTAANALLGLELKNKERMSTTIATKDGLAKKIVTEFQNTDYRSYIQNGIFDPTKMDPSKEPVMQVIGHEGVMIVAQTMLNQSPYVSQVDLKDINIDYNFMDYLKQSNQVQSVLITTAKLDDNLKLQKVVGMLIQLFPEHTDEDINFLNEKLGNNQFVANVLLKSTNYASLIQEIVEDAIELSNEQLHFKCTCSYEKSLSAVKMLPQEELKEIVEQGKEMEVVCDFCKKNYIIPIDEIKKLIK